MITNYIYNLKTVLLTLLISFSVNAFAQYTGGNGSGHSRSLLINTSCSVGNSNPYTGGVAEGSSNEFLNNSSCTASSSNPFAGGNADGYASIRIINIVCTYGSTNIFAGGVSDGFSYAAFVNTLCSYGSTNPFTGGNADGYAYALLSNVTCSVNITSPYLGGNADGHSYVALLNTTCLNSNSNPFRGGRNDSYTNKYDIICGVSPLPIELLLFSAKHDGNNVAVLWTTASEKNSDYYSLEKSKDGNRFSQFAQVKAAGNSTKNINYRTLDYSPYSGISYYRLKQTDFNGEFQYSKTVEVNIREEINCSIYPNPNLGQKIYVSLTGNKNAPVKITIFDASGMKVRSYEDRFERTGEKTFLLEMHSKLQAGIYMIVINMDQKSINKKMVVE